MESNPTTTNYLSSITPIIRNKDFETGVVKIQNNDLNNITQEESAAISVFRVTYEEEELRICSGTP